MNAVGLHADVQTLLHEGGHAFHVFEFADLPYYQQMQVGMEFAEVASMAMELLAAPYLTASEGGFYSEEDAARARVEHLESIILFWPYMAVVDAFQHWVYEHHAEASNPRACDATWAELWERFMPGVDWTGLEEELVTGWHRKRHIPRAPFYYVEYGLAQLGAVQVWRNALSDQAGAVGRYRQALALGGTIPLPELYATAGAALAFDAEPLRAAVALLEQTIETLETA
jgi:oligoendopeptidase F